MATAKKYLEEEIVNETKDLSVFTGSLRDLSANRYVNAYNLDFPKEGQRGDSSELDDSNLKEDDTGSAPEPKLTEQDRDELADAFRDALDQIDDPGVDAKKLKAIFGDLAMSGRLTEVFAFCSGLVLQPPAKAPELWNRDGGETPGDAVARIYGYWLERDRMHYAALRKLDPTLSSHFARWKRLNQTLVPETVAEKLLTLSEFNTRLMNRLDEVSADERYRLDQVKRQRESEGRRISLSNKTPQSP